MAIPLVCGLTTIPSRIEHLRPTIDSLVNQTRSPDQIFLTLPKHCDRQPDVEYDIPRWAHEYPSLQIIRSDQDYGPGTKLLGCLPRITEPSCLVVVDDDMRYRPTMLDRLYTAQLVDKRSSFSFYTYSWGPLHAIGQGADGFSFFTPNLAGIEEFAREAISYRPLRLHDDVWISAFLQRAGVAIKNLRELFADSQGSFDKSHELDQLSDLQGDHSRDNVTARGIHWLVEHGHFGALAKWDHLARVIIKKLLGLQPHAG